MRQRDVSSAWVVAGPMMGQALRGVPRTVRDMSSITSLTEMLSNVADDEWVRHGACADLPVDKIDRFFVEAGARIESEYEALCARCIVRSDCLAHAVQGAIPAGYFGGMSPSQRRRIDVTAG